MADLIGLTVSAAGGGIFGLVGTALGRVAGFIERRQHHAHEEARWQHESELLKLQMQASAQETEADLALAETSGRWEGLQASMAAEAAIGMSYPWVNAIRGLTRPALTFMLWIITVGIFLQADVDGRQAIVETATFAATAATLWWFGGRGPRREPRR